MDRPRADTSPFRPFRPEPNFDWYRPNAAQHVGAGNIWISSLLTITDGGCSDIVWISMFMQRILKSLAMVRMV